MVVFDHPLPTGQGIDNRVDPVVEQPPNAFGVLLWRAHEAELFEQPVRDEMGSSIEFPILPRHFDLARLSAQAPYIGDVQVVLGGAVESEAAPRRKAGGFVIWI